jgi:type IV pilus assembly protein PilO
MELSLTKLPWYAQVGAFVVLAVGACGAFYYYYEMPVKTELESRRGELLKLRAQINKGVTTAKQLPEFKAEVTNLESRLENLRAVLPEEKDAADLLRRMQTVAAQSNLVIKSFKPAPVVTKQLHAEWPINLELEGTYHNLAMFFDRVGKFTRIVNISGLDVKGRDRAGDVNATITATCVATTFVLLDKPAPAGRGAKPGAKPAPPRRAA